MEPANHLHIESLPEGWTDKDIIMLHACFQLLTNAIEKQHLFSGELNWDFDESSRKAKAELEELYQWWIQRKNQENTLEQNRYEKDTEMLIRLIKVRGYMWI